MNIITKDSPLYLKRLVRELNAAPDGFYVYSHAFDGAACFRSNRARMKNGELQVCRNFNVKKEWVGAGDRVFSDAYGREIVASRTIK